MVYVLNKDYPMFKEEYHRSSNEQTSFLTNNAITDVPTNVALQYNHRLSRTPEINAVTNE
jgi:hypothetical protein